MKLELKLFSLKPPREAIISFIDTVGAFFVESIMEEWKDIEGYEDRYQISNKGRVRSLMDCHGYERIKLRKLFIRTDGHYGVVLTKNYKKEHKTVHRLVLLAFKGKPKKGEEAKHIDGIKKHNMIYNLEWALRSEIMKHAYHTLKSYSINREGHPNAKLNNKSVEQIKSLLYERIKTDKEISNLFNVSISTIINIKAGRAWKNVPCPNDKTSHGGGVNYGTMSCIFRSVSTQGH